MSETIGVIGLGLMGGALARNLRAAGYAVVGFDTDASIAGAAHDDGIEIASGAAGVASQADEVFLSLPTPEAVFATAQDLIDCGVSSRILIETSTLDLDDKLHFAAMVAAADHVPLDCPISGTSAQAEVGDIVILASGASAAIARLAPVFGAIGREVFDLGEYGNGSRMKFIANLLVAIHNVASGEAMALAKKAGLDPYQVVRVIGAGAGTSRIFELRAPMMAAGCYEPPTMRLSTWQKDMGAIAAFAASLDFPTTLFDATRGIYDAAISAGLGAQDTAAVCATIETMRKQRS